MRCSIWFMLAIQPVIRELIICAWLSPRVQDRPVGDDNVSVRFNNAVVSAYINISKSFQRVKRQPTCTNHSSFIISLLVCQPTAYSPAQFVRVFLCFGGASSDEMLVCMPFIATRGQFMQNAPTIRHESRRLLCRGGFSGCTGRSHEPVHALICDTEHDSF